MTLTEMFTICDSCVYAPCLCGNDPENCVAYVMRTSDNGSDVGPAQSAATQKKMLLRSGTGGRKEHDEAFL